MSPNRCELLPPSTSQETKEARARRLSAVTDSLKNAFQAAVDQLGLDDATRIWNQIPSSKKRRRGRPPKLELLPDEISFLKMYELIDPDSNRRAQIRIIAKVLHIWDPDRYRHVMVKSTESKLRNLVKSLEEGSIVRVGNSYKMIPRRRLN
jgi:hypothetical protein